MEDLSFERKIFNIFGMYPEKTFKLLTWRRFRQFLTLGALAIHEPQILMHMLYANFDQATSSVLWMTEIGFMLKLGTFIYHEKAVSEIEDMLKKPILSKYPSEYKFVRKDMNMTIILLKTEMFLVTSVITFLIFYAPAMNTDGKRHLPSDAHVPCSLDGNICFFGFYAFHAINLYLTGFLNVAMDCMFCKLIMICSCIIEVMCHNLENIDYKNNTVAIKELNENIFRHMEVLK